MINLYKIIEKRKLSSFLTLLLVVINLNTLIAQVKIDIDWNNEIIQSKTEATLQVVVNPLLKRGSVIHDGTFEAMKNLKANFVRFVPWFPYPHGAVPQLKEPMDTETFWNFNEIDPIMEDMMTALGTHSMILNFSTIPDWMFEGEPVKVPEDPDQAFWDYNRGRKLKDTTAKQVGAYFARIFSWYTQGGFTDELGNYHKSGYHYNIPYWEVLNEPDIERFLTPQVYTKIYDETVKAIKKIDPDVQFIGVSVAQSNIPEWFEYFLNHENHEEGIPLDGISYHFYAFSQEEDEDMKIGRWQYSFFKQADYFLEKVKYIESIRKRLSPETFTDLNELGVILWGKETHSGYNIPGPSYWNLAGAMYAYLYVELAKLGIEIAGQSQLVGYPTQFPSVSMMNWETGEPNARYWVLKLLNDNFGPGDQLMNTESNTDDIVAQAFVTEEGKKLLLINKRNRGVDVDIPNISGATVSSVDVSTVDNPAYSYKMESGQLVMKPFSVSVIKIK